MSRFMAYYNNDNTNDVYLCDVKYKQKAKKYILLDL